MAARERPLRIPCRATRGPRRDPPQPRGEPRRADRGARRGARADGRGLRLRRREARRARARRRAFDRPRTRGARSGSGHRDRFQDVLRRRRPACACADRARHCGRTALRDARRPRRGAAHPRRVAARRAFCAAWQGGRGDGRLLGLRQGRWLPRRAVGHLPGAGVARRDCACTRCRADDLPRPRRQHGTRRRADARRDRFPAARAPAGAVEADRARRDRLVQVRARGACARQSRGGACGDAPSGVSRGDGETTNAQRAGHARAALTPLARTLRRVCLERAALRPVLPALHACGRAGAAGDRLPPDPPAGRRGLPRLVARSR